MCFSIFLTCFNSFVRLKFSNGAYQVNNYDNKKENLLICIIIITYMYWPQWNANKYCYLFVYFHFFVFSFFVWNRTDPELGHRPFPGCRYIYRVQTGYRNFSWLTYSNNNRCPVVPLLSRTFVTYVAELFTYKL